jgi:hypothetical protein
MRTKILYILIICQLLSCSKEKKIKKNSYINEDAIFLSGYINNKSDKSIAIFGFDLPAKGISFYIDSGIGWQQQTINYDGKILAYYCDLTKFKFKPNYKYRFKLFSKYYNDSLVLEKSLPDSFNTIVNTSYPLKTEFFSTLKFSGPTQNGSIYSHDIYTSGTRGDTINQVSPLSGNIYQSKFLPYLRDLSRREGNLDDFISINNLNVYDGIRLPYQITYLPKCFYNPIVQKIWYSATRFYKSDFEYINSICENIINEGNPFFINYQPKNIVKSHSGKIFGVVVSSFISGPNSFIINDPSDTLITLAIKLKGKDIIDDPGYRITRAVVKNFSFDYFYKAPNKYCFTENALRIMFEKCQIDSKYDKSKDITIQFAVLNKLTNKTKLTNSITFKYSQTQTNFIFEVQ